MAAALQRGGGADQPIMRTVAAEVARGRWVHIFPEGKVNYTGQLGPLRWGVGKLVCDAMARSPGNRCARGVGAPTGGRVGRLHLPAPLRAHQPARPQTADSSAVGSVVAPFRRCHQRAPQSDCTVCSASPGCLPTCLCRLQGAGGAAILPQRHGQGASQAGTGATGGQ